MIFKAGGEADSFRVLEIRIDRDSARVLGLAGIAGLEKVGDDMQTAGEVNLFRRRGEDDRKSRRKLGVDRGGDLGRERGA